LVISILNFTEGTLAHLNYNKAVVPSPETRT